MSPDAQLERPPNRRLVLVGLNREAHLSALIAAGYHAVGVADMQQALTHRPRPDGLIVELRIPEDLAGLKDWRSGPHTAALAVIGLAGDDTRDAVVKAGATFCRFPCPPEDLVAILKQVIPLTPPVSPA